jgi:hypothetical protein
MGLVPPMHTCPDGYPRGPDMARPVNRRVYDVPNGATRTQATVECNRALHCDFTTVHSLGITFSNVNNP